MTDPLNVILILLWRRSSRFSQSCDKFCKLSVVFGLIRNALGVQQIPPNIALNALAIILSSYIMAPVVMETYDLVAAAKPNFASVDGLKTAYEIRPGTAGELS